MTEDQFIAFDKAHPEMYAAWILLCAEQRLDPWRKYLGADGIIYGLRQKGMRGTNDLKPWYARKYNAEHNDGGILFKIIPCKCEALTSVAA